MTFYEAAIQVLLQAGQPLHANEIAKRAIQEKLLSHVGKDPEGTMASRLAAMARRSQDRRLVAVEPDTFGLTDWNLRTSPEALEQSGVVEEPDEQEPPLRPRERHPTVDKSKVRVSGRGDRRRRHEDGDRKRRKRLGPIPEYVFELLGKLRVPVPLLELAAAVREKDLVADDLGKEALGEMLAAENLRREEEGRRPLFALYDDGMAGLQGGPEPKEGEEQDWTALVEEAARALAEERKPQPRSAPAAGRRAVERALEEQRQAAIRQLRRRLQDLDAAGLEAVAGAMLDAMGYRDVRVAKRHKDGSLFTTRRRMGLAEVRFAVRVIRGGREVRREDIAELRRDMASHSAQLGVIVSPNDVTREAKNEASQAAQPLVTLLCADALADQLAEREVGVVRRTVTYVDYDEPTFRRVLRSWRSNEGGDDEEPSGRRSGSASEERKERRERERKEWRERRERAREERRRQREERERASKAAAEAGDDNGENKGDGDSKQKPPEEKAEGRDRLEPQEAPEGAADREAPKGAADQEADPIPSAANEDGPFGESDRREPKLAAGGGEAGGHQARQANTSPVDDQEADRPVARPPSGDES